MGDIYDDEVARLTANPKLIYYSWLRAEPLFGFMTKDRNSEGLICGCPAMVKFENYGVAATALPGLREMIKALPLKNPKDSIIVDSLPFYAQAQRLGDQMIPGRVSLLGSRFAGS